MPGLSGRADGGAGFGVVSGFVAGLVSLAGPARDLRLCCRLGCRNLAEGGDGSRATGSEPGPVCDRKLLGPWRYLMAWAGADFGAVQDSELILEPGEGDFCRHAGVFPRIYEIRLF